MGEPSHGVQSQSQLLGTIFSRIRASSNRYHAMARNHDGIFSVRCWDALAVWFPYGIRGCLRPHDASTETKSPEKKREMEEHAEHHMNEAVATFKEIWREADPELRQKMKTDLTKLMGEMN